MKISVWITSYNQKDLLKEAIESVLCQSLKPIQIIVVDDFSNDGSTELIKSYINKYPELIEGIFHERNKGVAQVRISALQNIKGDFVTYVDGDDLFLPKKLEVEADLISQGDYQIAFSNNMYFKDSPSNIEYIWAYNKSELPQPGNMQFETISRSFPRGSLFRMELVNFKAWQQIGYHDTNLKIYEDYDMRIRLSKNLKINYTIEPLTKIRLGENGLSKSKKSVQLDCLNYIYKKHMDYINSFPNEKNKIIHDKFKFMLENLNEKKAITENEKSGILMKTKLFFKKK